jgi:predicted nucleic acid-binding protein
VAKEKDNLPSVYLDSCCFIDIVKHSFGKLLANDHEQHLARLKEVWAYKKMLQAAIDRKLRVFTSTMTQVECNSVDGDISQPVQDAFDRLFEASNCVTPVTPTHAVNDTAKSLKWKHNVNLNPMDAIQVASALVAGAKEFVTTDGMDNMGPKKILTNAGALETLGLRVTLATGTRQLPDEYKSDELFSK